MFKNLSTSKQLTWVVLVFFLLQVSFSAFYILYRKDLLIVELLKYTTPIMMTIIFSYFGKAGFEKTLGQPVNNIEQNQQNY